MKMRRSSRSNIGEGRVEVDDKINGEKVTLTPGKQALLQGKEMIVRQVNYKIVFHVEVGSIYSFQ